MKKKGKKEPKIVKSHFELLPVFVALFIVGIIISEQFSSDLFIVWISISVAALSASFFLKTAKAQTISLLVAALFASMFYGTARFKPVSGYSDLLTLDNTSGTIYGRYTGESTIQKNNKILYAFKEVTYSIDNLTIDIPFKINCKTTINRQRLYPEQYYSLTGKMRIISFDTLPVFEVASFSVTQPKLPSIKTTFKELQTKIKDSLTSELKKEHSAIVTGFLLGDTSQISDKSIFIETGISHVLAISGQHIMIIILFTTAILHWFKIPPISRFVLTSLILTFYAMITVGSPSVWRALIMYLSVSITFLLESSSSPMKPVSIAAFFMLLHDPSLLHNASFILSFTAVLSIIFLSSPIKFLLSKIYLPESISRYLAVTFAANLGIMPMSAYIFGTVSLSSLFVNPLILWTFTFILPLGFIIAFLSIFSISTLLLNSGYSILLDSLIQFLEYVKGIPGLYFYVGNISSFTILCIYATLLFLISIFNKWQIKYVEALNHKHELDRIPETRLPRKKAIKIHIDKDSKATPTLLGKTALMDSTIKKQATAKIENPFQNTYIVEAIDDLISNLKRIKTNNSKDLEDVIPVNILNVDGQNLYYRLFSMDKNLFIKEPERLLQAHIFTLAITGFELLNRINNNLEPPLSLDSINLDIRVNDKYLAIAILSDFIMASDLQPRVNNPQLKEIIEEGQALYLEAQNLLKQILDDKDFNGSIEKHLILREELVKWCWKFIKYDNISKLRKKKNLR